MYPYSVANNGLSTIRVPLFDMICALSTALDLLDPALGSHQKRTCLIAAQIARSMSLSDTDYQNVFGAAIFHDIGAIGLNDRLSMLDFEEHDAHIHAHLGALLLARFPSFACYAPLVNCHHVQWNHGLGQMHDGQNVPMMSHLIYLSDRIEVLAQGQDNILGAAPEIVAQICAESGRKFHPHFVTAFCKIAQQESFWLDIFSNNLDRILKDIAPFENIDLELDHVLQFAQFFALIIDSRSHFTATHSAGVAITAETIARHLGMGDQECMKVRMAGYLHDLGKLAIPSEFIERAAPLSEKEIARVRSHSYLTLDILSMIGGLEDVAEWAASHHERLDGSGYPFHLTAKDLSLGARILAVADVYTALTEDRPYRPGVPPDTALAMLDEWQQQGKLDGHVIAALHDNLAVVESARVQAQHQEGIDLAEFWQSAVSPSVTAQKVRYEKSHYA
ncbi:MULTISPECIES: HD-GYP domain-containing protein [Deefgea]|uniref:HD domain-containing protein n=1 Tax=Deefgea chitinilytica TaxID=570276 RepID=A0ABS2CBM0_9NEIS|nr:MULTISPECIES: HD domain-containing phosphohydrolase [Deefgea]MBM5571549.1 HD domain-containing protein [Deefgea chitinilytica]MBM9888782.1 HD domain-containing protein [Deefgea sp. CFH1-16]